MKTLWQDLRYGARMLAKDPGFAAIAVLTLALGIGANTAIFSVVNAVLLEPLPYKDARKLVNVWSTMISQGVPISGASAPDFREWRARNGVFTDMAAATYSNLDFSAPGEEPARLQGAAVTPGMFPMLGVGPALGRNFAADEEQWGRHRVVLLSYGLWKSKFAGEREALGKTIRLEGEEFTVVGVMPKGMPFFDDLPPVDLYVPLAFAPKDDMNTRGNHYLLVVGRLKLGVSLAQSEAEMARISAQLEREFPENKGMGTKVVPLQEQLVGDARTTLVVLLGAVAFVLLIACVNVANLMLARSTAREQEFAVRSALGASRKRLVGQLLLESLPIALAGGLGGVLLANWGIQLLVSLIPTGLPRFNPIEINGGVLVFTAVISLLTAVLSSLAPALHASKTDIQETLRERGRGGTDSGARHGLRSLLVVSELALAVLLLVGAGLLVKTFGALHRADPGFSPEHVLAMELPLSSADFPTGHQEQGLQFFEDLTRRINALPGVRSSGITTSMPLGFGGGWGKNVDIQGRAPATSLDQVPIVRFQLNTPGYLPSIGARLRAGRYFTDQDNQKSEGVAIVNQSFAKRFFPNENPIGKSIRMLPPLGLLPPEARVGGNVAPLRTIVGVIADLKDASLNLPARETVIAPYTQYKNEGWDPDPYFAVRTTGDPLASAAAIRDAIRSLVADQPVEQVQSMNELLDKSLSQTRFSALLLSLFACLAIVLAAIGIYGVMSYAVAQRTHEIGIRIALGARRHDVLRLVLGQGARLVLAGAAMGIIAALGLTRLMTSLLYGVSPSDPATFTSVAIVLALVAFAACLIPARRAMTVEPMIALRHE